MGRRKIKRIKSTMIKQEEGVRAESVTPTIPKFNMSPSLGHIPIDDVIKILEGSLALTILGVVEADFTETKMEYASLRLCAAVHALFSEINNRHINDILILNWFKRSMAKFEEQQQLMCLDLKQIEMNLNFNKHTCHVNLQVAVDMMVDTIEVFRKELSRLVNISLTASENLGNVEKIDQLQERVLYGFYRLFMPIFYVTESWEFVYQKRGAPLSFKLILPGEEVSSEYTKFSPSTFMYVKRFNAELHSM